MYVHVWHRYPTMTQNKAHDQSLREHHALAHVLGKLHAVTQTCHAHNRLNCSLHYHMLASKLAAMQALMS